MTYYVSSAGLPLTGVREYYTPENLAKTPKIRWPAAYEYAQNKMAGVAYMYAEN